MSERTSVETLPANWRRHAKALRRYGGETMQPWKISAGLTAAIAGSAILLAGPRLEYLAPYWPLLLAEHGVLLALHLALALAAVAAAIYAVARAAGLADLGRRVDLAYIKRP